MSDYYDRDGRPMDMLAWAKTMDDRESRSVGLDDIGDVRVSTVWLGLDHQFEPDGPPLIFETMIFGGRLDQEQWRYATEAEAIEGHARAVELVKMDRLVP